MHRRAAGRIVRRVVARAAVKAVRPRAADQHVVAIAARQRIVARAAHQRIVAVIAVEIGRGGPGGEGIGARGADEFLDIGESIALRIAARGGAGGKVDRDTDCGIRIGNRIEACAAVHHVGPAAAAQHIVARAAVQGIVARRARQAVVARPARQHIVGIGPGQGIVEIGADQLGDPVQPVAGGNVALPGAAVERDIHCRRRRRIGCSIEAATADHAVGPDPGNKGIVARAAAQRIGAGPARQRIVVVRADNGLDRDQRIARRIADRARIGGETDRHRAGGIGVGGGITARPAIEHIGPAAADQGIVAKPAAQRFRRARADQHIGKVRTDDALDIADDIAGRLAARAFGDAVEIDGDRRAAARIVRRVDPRTAVDHIRAGAADESIVADAAQQGVGPAGADQAVVARAAFQHVAGRTTDQGIVVLAADQMLDARQHIALRVAARARARGKVDGDRRAAGRIVRRVEAVAAHQRIRPRAADQHVVAVLPDQRIGLRAADQSIVEGRALDHFDPGQHVARGIAAKARGAIGIDRDARPAGRIVRRVDPRPAVKAVRPRAADQRVIACPAREAVIAGLPQQEVVARAARDAVGIGAALNGIVKGAADHRLDIAEHIARRIARGASKAIHPHRDPRAGRGIVRRVDPRAAVEHIGPGAADQRIVAGATQQGVVAAARRNEIVARPARKALRRARTVQRIVEGRTDQHLDAGEHVARGIAARARSAIQIGAHCRAAGRIVDRIGARAAHQRIGPQARHEGIVARAALDAVGKRRAIEQVGLARPDQVFDADQHIALGIAAVADCAIQIDRDARQAGRIVGGVKARPAVQRIGTGAADQGIVAGIAVERIVAPAARYEIVARAAVEHLGRVRPAQPVIIGRADQLFDTA